MLRKSHDSGTALRSTSLAGIAGAALLISLLIPSSASAAESTPSGGQTSGVTALTPEELTALSERQISIANSGLEKFSSADLVAKVRIQLEADRVAREKKRAEEAAAAQAAAEAKARAEAEAAEAAAKAEAEKKAAEEAARKSSSSTTGSGPSKPLYTGGGSKDEWLSASGIDQSDWGYVEYIVNRESSWNPNALNSGSGASGLVQALPCGKVPGNCFDPVDNLKWADGYAKGRYGSWALAYDFWTTNHWW